MKTASPRLREALLLVLPLAYWAWVLFADMGARAFDPSDPSDQLGRAVYAADKLRQGGVLEWISFLLSDTYAMPVLHGLLSLGIVAGLPPDHVVYKSMAGGMTLLVLGLVQWVLWRRRGLAAALGFAAAAAGSNILLGQAYYGGHPWFGQAFLWAVLARWGGGLGEIPRRGRGSFLLGLLLGASVLSSFYLIPYAGSMAALWALQYARAGRRHGWPWGPPAALAGGVLFLPAFFEAATFAVPRTHFWTVFLARFSYALDTDMAYKSMHGYLLRYLSYNESLLFWLPVLGLAGLGLWSMARRCAEGESGDEALVLVPVLAYAYLELPGSLRLGRGYLPLLVFLCAAAGVGLSEALERLRDRRLKTAALCLCLLLLGAAGTARKLETRRAFFAGREVRAALESAAAPSLNHLVVGFSVPYSYLPGHDKRVTFIDDLRAEIRAGHRWVLVSRLSNWYARGLLDEGDGRRIPVSRAYSSSAPYIAVGGVETIPFELFTNDALFYRVERGEIPFPVENRLYRAGDFMRACGL